MMNTALIPRPRHDIQASTPSLPPCAGLGLKSQHFKDVLEQRPDIGFFEVHAENYMVAGGPFHHYLGLIRQEYPLSLHGVGLSLAGDERPDRAHLARFRALLGPAVVEEKPMLA